MTLKATNKCILPTPKQINKQEIKMKTRAVPASVDTGTKHDQLNWSYLPYIYVPLPKLLCAKFGQVLNH